jgi:hypothetical protein
MKTSYDIEMERTFADLIESDVIKILDSEKYFKKLEKNYPIGLNKINWEKIDKKIFEAASRNLLNNKNYIKKKIEQFLNKVVLSCPSISNELITVFGDEAIEQAYQMNFSIFKKYAYKFFCLPQHTYVLTETNLKCINYTFEGELYFG